MPSSFGSQLVGEAGLGLGRAGLQRDERLEDLRDGADGLAVRDQRAVEHDRVGGAGEDERAAFGAAGLLGGGGAARFLVVSAARARNEHEAGDEHKEREQAHELASLHCHTSL